MSVKMSEWWPYIQGPYDDKWGYIYGMAGVKWTREKQDALIAKYNSDPERYSDLKLSAEKGSKWIGNYVIDCSGMPYRAFNKCGVKIAHGSNSIWNSYLKTKGKLTPSVIDTLPKGAAVFTGTESKKPHIGTYDGDGFVIEAQGTNAGVVKSPVTLKKWTYWGLYKDLEYDGAPAEEPDEPAAGYPTLRKGSKGEDVKRLQELLIGMGYDLGSWGADGDYGKATEAAVRKFQQEHGLTADGIAGPKTWAALEAEETQERYTVVIPNLTRYNAETLVHTYQGATMTAEGGE